MLDFDDLLIYLLMANVFYSDWLSINCIIIMQQ